jgi:uncharacterized membrane protein
MQGLTTLGVFHTIISLVAVVAGFLALVRYKSISPRNLIGQVYIVGTVVTCLTGFFIFQHGGFGKPHALGILTMIVLAIALLAGYSTVFGRGSRYVETIAYSMTLFFHFIPGITETSTRLPPGAPLVASPEAPELVVVTGVLFVVFLIGAFVQVRQLRRSTGIAEKA